MFHYFTFALKCTKMRLAARLHLVQLGELTAYRAGSGEKQREGNTPQCLEKLRTPQCLDREKKLPQCLGEERNPRNVWNRRTLTMPGESTDLSMSGEGKKPPQCLEREGPPQCLERERPQCLGRERIHNVWRGKETPTMSEESKDAHNVPREKDLTMSREGKTPMSGKGKDPQCLERERNPHNV